MSASATEKPSISIPKPPDLLKDFARRHSLTLNDLLEGELVAVRAVASADLWVTAGYAGLDDAALQDPAVGMLLNMFNRNCELVEGAVAAFVTECGQAAEVASRAAVESAVNLAYIAAGVPKDRLRAYFEHYFDATNDRQLRARLAEIGTMGRSTRF